MEPIAQFLDRQQEVVTELTTHWSLSARRECATRFASLKRKLTEIDERYAIAFDRTREAYLDAPEGARNKMKILAAAMESEMLAEIRAFYTLARQIMLLDVATKERVQ